MASYSSCRCHGPFANISPLATVAVPITGPKSARAATASQENTQCTKSCRLKDSFRLAFHPNNTMPFSYSISQSSRQTEFGAGWRHGWFLIDSLTQHSLSIVRNCKSWHLSASPKQHLIFTPSQSARQPSLALSFSFSNGIRNQVALGECESRRSCHRSTSSSWFSSRQEQTSSNFTLMASVCSSYFLAKARKRQIDFVALIFVRINKCASNGFETPTTICAW
jgi:hypothetical protein